MYEVVPLTNAHLDRLRLPEGLDRRAYFTEGSRALCLLADGDTVFAGGIVNLQWSRGEVWCLPTPFFQRNIRTCFRHMRDRFPALVRGFVRVQSACIQGKPTGVIRFLGFSYEGTLAKFGPNGEACDMYARICE